MRPLSNGETTLVWTLDLSVRPRQRLLRNTSCFDTTDAQIVRPYKGLLVLL